VDNKPYVEIEVTEDFTVKKVVISMVDGGIDARQEDAVFKKGDLIKTESSNPSSLDECINITMHDASTLMEVPISKITYKIEASKTPAKTGGCGGCGKRRS